MASFLESDFYNTETEKTDEVSTSPNFLDNDFYNKQPLSITVTPPREEKEEEVVPEVEVKQQQETEIPQAFDSGEEDSAPTMVSEPITAPRREGPMRRTPEGKVSETERMLEEQAKRRAMTSVERTNIGASKGASDAMKELVKDPKFMEALTFHYENFDTDDGKRLKGESDVAYLNRYLKSWYRAVQFNQIERADLKDFLENTDDKNRLAFGKMYSDIELKLPELLDGNQTNIQRFQAIADGIYYTAYDPVNLMATAVTTAASVMFPPAAVASGANVVRAVAATNNAATRSIRASLINRGRAGASYVGKKAKEVKQTVTSRAGITGASIEGIGQGFGDLELQAVEKLGHVDPSTREYKPDVASEDLETNWLRTGIVGAAGYTFGAVGAHGAIRRGMDYRAAVEAQKEQIKRTARETRKRVIASDPISGRFSSQALELANIIEEAGETLSPRKLMETVSKDFPNVDPTKVSKEVYEEVHRAINNPIFHGQIANISVEMQGKLAQEGLLDALGEHARNAFYAYKPNRKGTASAAEVIANGFEGINRFLYGKQDDFFVKTKADGTIEFDSEKLDIVTDILEEAVAASGMAKEDFIKFMALSGDDYAKSLRNLADVSKVTYSNAGKQLASARWQAEKIKRFLVDIDDPVVNEILERQFGASTTASARSLGQRVWNGLQTWSRGRAGMLTSQPVTTGRNVIGGTYMVGLNTGVDLVDTIWVHMGLAQKALAKPDVTFKEYVDGTLKGMREIATDTFSLTYHLLSALRPNTAKAARGRAAIESMLASEGKLSNNIFRNQADILGEADTKAGRLVNRSVEFVNQFNIMADSFLRRGYFLNRMDKLYKNMMRDYKAKTGTEFMEGRYKNILEYVEAGYNPPVKMKREAADWAMKQTFAGDPESAVGRDMLRTINKYYFVSSTAAGINFPKFMMNATRTMYEYDPSKAVVKLGTAMFNKNKAAADTLDDLGKPISDRELYIKSAIGSAAIVALWNSQGERDPREKFDQREGKEEGTLFPYAGKNAQVYVMRSIAGLMGLSEEPWNSKEVKRALEQIVAFPIKGVEDFDRAFTGLAKLLNNIFNDEGDSAAKSAAPNAFVDFLGAYFQGVLTPLAVFNDMAMSASVDNYIEDVRVKQEGKPFWVQVGIRATSRIPKALLGDLLYDEDERETRNVLGQTPTPEGSGMKPRMLSARLLGLAYTPEVSDVKREIDRLGLTQNEVLSTSPSSRLANKERYYFNQLSADGLEYLINRDEYYNGDVDPDTGEPFGNINEKTAYQRAEFLNEAELYRQEARNLAANEDIPKAKELRKEASIQLQLLLSPGSKATEQEKADAYFNYIAASNNGITGDVAKSKWIDGSKKAYIGRVERYFADKYEQAQEKFKRGGVDALQTFDYLYLRGPSIEDQKSYGLALIVQKNMESKSKGRRQLRQMIRDR